jgi:hypothetical protein
MLVSTADPHGRILGFLDWKVQHTYNTRNNNDYHRCVDNLELYNSKPSVAGYIFYNKLPNNILQTGYNTHFKKELRTCLLRGAIIQPMIISINNSVILDTDKLM